MPKVKRRNRTLKISLSGIMFFCCSFSALYLVFRGSTAPPPPPAEPRTESLAQTAGLLSTVTFTSSPTATASPTLASTATLAPTLTLAPTSTVVLITVPPAGGAGGSGGSGGGGSPGITQVSGPCSCNGDTMNCTHFRNQKAAQACYDHCKSLGYGDIHRLDRDNDGLACEG